MKWQVDSQTKKISLTESAFRTAGDDYAKAYFTIYSYFCHPDGDRMRLSEQQKEIIDDIVEFDQVSTPGGHTAGLICRVKSGRRLYIKLIHCDSEGNLYSDLKFDWNFSFC